MGKKKTNKKILFLAIWKSRWYILKYYPKMIYMANHPSKYTEQERYDYTIKLINFLLKACDVQVSVFGQENIPAEDGFLVCSNHQEKFDPLVIWKVFPRRIGVVVNDTACHRPFIREVCLLIRSLKLFQNDMHSMVDVITRLTAELTNKRNYMIFPEGWYEEDPFTLSEFKGGCFKSVVRSKAPILPVALIDSYKLFKHGVQPPYEIKIHFLKPILYDEYKNLKTIEIAALVREKIQAAVDEFQVKQDTV